MPARAAAIAEVGGDAMPPPAGATTAKAGGRRPRASSFEEVGMEIYSFGALAVGTLTLGFILFVLLKPFLYPAPLDLLDNHPGADAVRLPSEVDCVRIISLEGKTEMINMFKVDAALMGFLNRTVVQFEKRDPEGGKAGCWRAHARASRLALAAGCKNLLVLEDDVYFTREWPKAMSNLRSVFSRARERGKDPFDIYFLGHMCSGEILHTEQEGVFETTYPLFTHAYIVPPKTMRIIASTKWPKTGVSDGGKEGYWSVDQNIDQWFAQTFYAGGKLVLGQIPSAAFQRKRRDDSAVTPIHDAFGGDSIIVQSLYTHLVVYMGFCPCFYAPRMFSGCYCPNWPNWWSQWTWHVQERPRYGDETSPTLGPFGKLPYPAADSDNCGTMWQCTLKAAVPVGGRTRIFAYFATHVVFGSLGILLLKLLFDLIVALMESCGLYRGS